MRIQKLKLFTNKLPKLAYFYGQVLGFEIQEKTPNSIHIKVGDSVLIFESSDQACYYHFAFNIPSFQSSEALKWLQERVEILPDETGSLIANFANWNAEAIYFLDPAGSIVEFIARKNLNIQTEKKFTSKSVLNISEMGMPVQDVKAHFDALNSQFESFTLKKYSGDFTRFCAAGDEEGLFIIVGPTKKLWYPTEKQALPFPFEIWFENSRKSFHLNTNNVGDNFILPNVKPTTDS